ncbi:MAG: hypothetical protein V7L05_23835 [Nostoc sp.]
MPYVKNANIDAIAYYSSNTRQEGKRSLFFGSLVNKQVTSGRRKIV